MPVVGLDVIFVRTAGRGALPEIPVECGRDGSIFADADRLARVVVPGFGIVGAADGALMDIADDFDGVRRGTLLCAHLHELAVLLLSADKQCALGGIVAAGLLDIDVFAGLESEDGHGRVPVVRRGDGDRVDVFKLENFAEVLFCLRGFAHLPGGGVGELGHDIRLDVADVGDAGGRMVGLRLERWA